jgi:hypothetical protein
MYELDEQAWTLVTAVVSAAHRSDANAFASTTTELTRVLDLERQRVVGLYVVYLLRYTLADIVGGRAPSADELTRLAREHGQAFDALLPRAEPRLLERTLLTAYKLIPARDEIDGALFSVSAAAATGILVKDPADDLNAIRPHLIEWCERHRGDFQRTAQAR